MDFFHFHIQMIQRSTGRSAVAAAAYRSGARIVNTWDGTHARLIKKRKGQGDFQGG